MLAYISCGTDLPHTKAVSFRVSLACVDPGRIIIIKKRVKAIIICRFSRSGSFGCIRCRGRHRSCVRGSNLPFRRFVCSQPPGVCDLTQRAPSSALDTLTIPTSTASSSRSTRAFLLFWLTFTKTYNYTLSHTLVPYNPCPELSSLSSPTATATIISRKKRREKLNSI